MPICCGASRDLAIRPEYAKSQRRRYRAGVFQVHVVGQNRIGQSSADSALITYCGTGDTGSRRRLKKAHPNGRPFKKCDDKF